MYGRKDIKEEYQVKTTENDFEQKAHLHIVVTFVSVQWNKVQDLCAITLPMLLNL